MRFQFSISTGSQVSHLVLEKLEKMAEQRKLLKASLESVNDRLNSAGDARAARLSLEENLEKFKRGWKKAAPIVQKRLLRKIFDCLIYTEEGIKTYYHLDVLGESSNQQNNQKMSGGENPSVISYLGLNQVLRRALVSSKKLSESSLAFANGAP